MLVAEATQAGVVEPEEKAMITGVMRLGDPPVRAIMTPRREIDWIDLDAEPAEIRRRIRESTHTMLPAAHGSIDEVAGVVRVRDVLDAYLDGRDVDIGALVRTATAIPDSTEALEAIGILKSASMQLALVVDEHGSLEGIVTTADFLEAIAGDFAEAREQGRPRATRRDDGSWIVDGSFAIDEFADMLMAALPEDRDYHTVAGFMLAELRRLPAEGSSVDWGPWTFEVIDMDGRRVDKILVRKRGDR
jgi:putative hemolysin